GPSLCFGLGLRFRSCLCFRSGLRLRPGLCFGPSLCFGLGLCFRSCLRFRSGLCFRQSLCFGPSLCFGLGLCFRSCLCYCSGLCFSFGLRFGLGLCVGLRLRINLCLDGCQRAQVISVRRCRQRARINFSHLIENRIRLVLIVEWTETQAITHASILSPLHLIRMSVPTISKAFYRHCDWCGRGAEINHERSRTAETNGF